MMGWNAHGEYMCAMMTSHIDGRIAYVKAELKITDAQASAWNAYAKAAKENAQAMSKHCTAMMSRDAGKPVSLPDRLDQHEQFMTAQLDSMRAMNKAVRTLYAGLSDSQKHDADELGWGMMGMMW
jgi:hypothetical protein